MVAGAAEQVWHLDEAVSEVEGRAGEVRRRADGQLSVVDDVDPVARGGARPPHGQGRCPLRAFEPPRGRPLLRVAVGRHRDCDRVARANGALAHDTGVHSAVVGVCLDGEPPVALACERVADRRARSHRARQLDDELVADRQARAQRQGRHVESLDRQVLAGRSGCDGMPLGRHAADRLDAQERDRAVRTAVSGDVGLAVALDAEPRDPRRLDRSLRDAAGRDVDLDEPPTLHRPIVLARLSWRRPLGIGPRRKRPRGNFRR